MNPITDWLHLHHAQGLSLRKIHQALQHGSLASLLAHEDMPKPDWVLIEADLAWEKAEANRKILSFADPLYPVHLKQIAVPPLILYTQGNLNALADLQFAIVGARNASPQGRENARLFAKTLGGYGFSIVSGLAEGIDTEAHFGALSGDASTIAVLGSGLACIYPRSNQKLAANILAKGLLMSEYAPKTQPKAHHFPARNRIIAGLSMGVLVVEAAQKSGSLITAKYARDEGREVFAVPGSIHHPLAKGCHQLIKQGAKLVENSVDILEELGGFLPKRAKDRKEAREEKNHLSPAEQLVYDAVGHEVTSTDVIILRSGLTASVVSSILLALELQGHIQSVIGGYTRLHLNFTSD